MLTAASIGLGFIVGCLVGSWFKEKDTFPAWEMMLEERGKRQEIEEKLYRDERELSKGCICFRGQKFPYKCPTCYPHYECYIRNYCSHTAPEPQKVYAPTPTKQEIVDLIQKAQLPLSEIVQKMSV